MIVPVTPVPATHAATAPTIAAAGRVNSHARAICPATPHCTDASRRPAPAPKIAPVATWVVDSAKPRWDEARMTVAALVSAAKPCGVWMSLTRLPSVWMIRQPPM
jgi:hypothetical protein